MTTNYFKVGKHVFFFNDKNKDSVYVAWVCAKEATAPREHIAVYKKPALSGPWDAAEPVQLVAPDIEEAA